MTSTRPMARSALPRTGHSNSIVWRQDNAAAELDLNGFDGKVTLADALALARKQQARLLAAAAHS